MEDPQAKYARLKSEIEYLQSFLPKDLGIPQLRDVTVWKSDIKGFTAATQAKLNQGQLATDRWVKRIGE
ncbi:hypothetical protein KY319_02555, partial [Candidatus Woesearchaeota archaeon]|nr:hypothetical protein [Candidatus Woesearchaeota archaeon]